MDLRSAIHDEIRDGSYVCLVCHNDIDSHSPIWSCRNCFRCFDIACIRDWSKRDSAKSSQWRCPHCLGPQSQKPTSIRYRCWCGKTANPSKASSSSNATYDPWESSLKSVTGSVPPHSCGQTCGAKRRCPHPCPLVCHAGPHLDSAECMYQGPPIKCFCGKKREQKLCSESRYGGFSCGSPCGRKHTKCGHKCTRPCHKAGRSRHGNDSCGPCRLKVSVTCYCGQMKPTKRACSSLTSKTQNDIKSHWKNKTEGLISCGERCPAMLKCGHHRCDLPCHPAEEAAHECALQPFDGETCCCGKVLAQRQNCTDPKLLCGNKCEKQLKCGHSCAQKCHDGPCPPCEVIVTGIPCRCKRTQQATTCYLAHESPPECDKPCGALLSCRRHECRRKCCQFSPKKSKGSNHSSANPKNRTFTLGELLQNGSNALRVHEEEVISEAEEAAHLCTRICGRLLGCGIHTCVQPCHAGACPPCLATSFDEWSCPCGRTRVEPPIRCGTVMPPCRYNCHRSQSCGHIAQHECHPDGVPCPPCTAMVPTSCKCGKSEISVICSRRNDDQPPQCMETCNRVLDCGHVCKKRCCVGGSACMPCDSQCMKKYESCGHAHRARCHFPQECPEECNQIIVAMCPCGVLKLPFVCGEDLEIGCNDVCVRESYPELVLDAYEEDKVWCSSIEIQIRSFVLQRPPKQSRTHWFKPMNRKRRRFVYYLLEHYKIEGQSMDEGANRSICAYRTKDTWLPKVRLSQARRKRPDVEVTLDENADEAEENPTDSGADDNDEHVDNSVVVDAGFTGDEDGWYSTPQVSSEERTTDDAMDTERLAALNVSKLARSFSLLSME